MNRFSDVLVTPRQNVSPLTVNDTTKSTNQTQQSSKTHSGLTRNKKRNTNTYQLSGKKRNPNTNNTTTSNNKQLNRNLGNNNGSGSNNNNVNYSGNSNLFSTKKTTSNENKSSSIESINSSGIGDEKNNSNNSFSSTMSLRITNYNNPVPRHSNIVNQSTSASGEIASSCPPDISVDSTETNVDLFNRIGAQMNMINQSNVNKQTVNEYSLSLLNRIRSQRTDILNFNSNNGNMTRSPYQNGSNEINRFASINGSTKVINSNKYNHQNSFVKNSMNNMPASTSPSISSSGSNHNGRTTTSNSNYRNNTQYNNTFFYQNSQYYGLSNGGTQQQSKQFMNQSQSLNQNSNHQSKVNLLPQNFQTNNNYHNHNRNYQNFKKNWPGNINRYKNNSSSSESSSSSMQQNKSMNVKPIRKTQINEENLQKTVSISATELNDENKIEDECKTNETEQISFKNLNSISTLNERENLSPNTPKKCMDQNVSNKIELNRKCELKDENQPSQNGSRENIFWPITNYPLRPASNASVLTEEMFLRASGIVSPAVSNSSSASKGSNGSNSTEGLISLPFVNAQQNLLLYDTQRLPNMHLTGFRSIFAHSSDPQSATSSSLSQNGRGSRNNRSNGRKWSQLDVSRNNICTPPDRFSNRAHMIELKAEPILLCNGSKYDQLSKSIWSKFSLRQQKEETYRKKMYLWKYLYTNIKVNNLQLLFFLFCFNM